MWSAGGFLNHLIQVIVSNKVSWLIKGKEIRNKEEYGWI